MVHRRDLDLSRGQVLDRMIGAMMALMHFHGLAADGNTEHLVAKTNAEGGHPGIDQGPDHRHRVLPGSSRITRAVGQEHAVWLEVKNIGRRGGGRHHRYLAAGASEKAQDITLYAVIDGDNVEF